MLTAEQPPTATLQSKIGKHGAGRTVQAGRLVACSVDETTVLLIGIGRSMTGDVAVEINEDRDARYTARVTNWRLSTPSPAATHGFAALVEANDPGRPFTTIRFGGAEGSRYVLTPRPIAADEAATLISDLGAATAVDRLVDVLMAETASPQRLSTVARLLHAARGNDGYIELLGENHDGAMFLQGWSHGMTPGLSRMSLIGGGKPATADCGIATFSRTDIPDGASGFVGLLDAGEAVNPHDVDGLVFRGRGGWRYAAVHPRKRIAGALETPEHIRSVLLRTHSSPEVLLSLRAAANSFEGKETVSGLPVPVRMGIDHAYATDGGTFLVSGWLLDPDNHVAAVRLRRGREAADLGEGWTRLDRPDVSEDFGDQPQFAQALRNGRHAHGFVAHARLAGGDPEASLYLELTLRDSRRAFLPLAATQASARMAALRQIASLDPTNWALPAIIDAQIVPLLAEASRLPPVIDTDAALEGDSFAEKAGPPIIIGFSEGDDDIAPLLALLALDPETRSAPIVIAMASERFRRQAARLGELVTFYDLSVRIVPVKDAGDRYDLLEAGVNAVMCETVVLLSASLMPGAKGWYGKLAAAAATLHGSIVSPILAYEDHSVRWAGSWISSDDSDHPLTGRYAGYPVKAVTELNLTKVDAASLECCIVPRDALLRSGGFSGAYLGSQEKGLDLGLRLSRSGVETFLLPTVQMWSCDEPAFGDTPAMAALVQEIDRTIFQRRWSAALAAETHSEKESA